MITIHDYEVDKRELIPTHSILRLELSKSSLKEERTYLRKVPSLKVCFENKVKQITKEMEPKEAKQKRENMVEELKEDMDENSTDQKLN